MPFGIDSLASDVARVDRPLPLLADRLEAIAASTSELPTMRAGIHAVAEDTEALSGVRAALDRLADEMGRLLASIDTLDANVHELRGRWSRSAAWPTVCPGTAGRPASRMDSSGGVDRDHREARRVRSRTRPHHSLRSARTCRPHNSSGPWPMADSDELRRWGMRSSSRL
jgi:hypothetical protein